MVRVGIYGATGYTGFELIKLLVRHPEVELVFATARSDAGKQLCDIFPTMLQTPLVAVEQADLAAVDLVFTCLPHNAPELVPLVQQALAAGKRVIDFSDTFRLRDPDDYERRRGWPHPSPELLAIAVYGLPELHRAQIRQAHLVANTGCYPLTAIVPLWPLVQADLFADTTVIVDSKSGISGAGRALALKTHFGETHETFSAYNIGRTHRHLGEMEQETGLHIIFSPHLLPVYRGILSTIYINLKPETTLEQARAAYGCYRDEPFLRLLPAGQLPELRLVQQSMYLAMGIQPVAGDPGRFIIVSALDNLLKGASGQAVQSMNIMFGLDETLGLG
ncbi:N-acetyl-gamma-glutamyl-phosphate reductase [Candidatus Viridilinea mediisalina]|uniref:N-acetyl-gamma-glutamyl-phosphate reductase n=1 Tax=Candidatus Viridilinea mediisalina TaxID=2024553 RepID=A0A2A6RG50_9CHLR|nr:N-acetyl-gamma-glutamyl-phosphate reductase [Candidatus Viridilinea mediisalina]PDW01859.1 N-acetyl-gamma-glutamyl-phosphate reductase [Candidatus Viridilinea mediisalina]